MKILKKAKDGGPQSPVDAFFLFEIKSLGSVALLRFNPGYREEFHSHAFNALTWFICGNMEEEQYNGTVVHYKRSFLPKITLRSMNHRVRAYKSSWAFTVRGPWNSYWTEDSEQETTVLTHGRQVVNKTYKKAPGLWIGSEMEDLNREMAELIAREIKGDSSVKDRQREIRRRRMEILKGEI